MTRDLTCTWTKTCVDFDHWRQVHSVMDDPLQGSPARSAMVTAMLPTKSSVFWLAPVVGVGVGGRRDWIQDCKVWDLMLECMRVFKLKWYLKLSPTEMFLSAGFWWGERSSSASIGIFYSKKLECLAQMTCRDARIDFCHTTKTASFWTWDNMIQKDKWFGWSLVESQVVYLVFKGSSFMTLGDLWHWNKMICCSTVLYWILYFCRV